MCGNIEREMFWEDLLKTQLLLITVHKFDFLSSLKSVQSILKETCSLLFEEKNCSEIEVKFTL